MNYVFCARCRAAWPWCSCPTKRNVWSALLYLLVGCGPATFRGPEGDAAPIGEPEPVQDAATDARVRIDASVDSALTDSSMSSNACHIVYNGDPLRIACGGSAPFSWESTSDAGQKTQVSCAEQACPFAAKCYVQGVPGSGVCAP